MLNDQLGKLCASICKSEDIFGLNVTRKIFLNEIILLLNLFLFVFFDIVANAVLKKKVNFVNIADYRIIFTFSMHYLYYINEVKTLTVSCF